jgi:hypothetical protein
MPGGSKDSGSKDGGSKGSGGKMDSEMETRIDTFLGEFRMVVPGVAALFGFQLTVAFTEKFARLSDLEKGLNFAGLACSALAFLFLLVPANYHRFIHRLEETDDFYHYAKKSNAIAFVFVPLAVAFSLAVQAIETFGSAMAGAAVFAAFLVAAALGWWIVPWVRANALDETGPRH